ncbi:MAG: SLC13 family permease [Oscillospiraceae bacterium]|nr:SLC13 family permease [Oscillospiraceae bacterium]
MNGNPLFPKQGHKKAKDAASFLLIAGVLGISVLGALAVKIPIKNVMEIFQYDVLIILITMELFTNLISGTNIMQYIAVRLAIKSNGSRRRILIFFGALMFLISPLVNNITAVLIILPVITVLLKAITLDRAYICVFFSILLSISNTGGAASPIGDFPAIVIMTSGITTFSDYLLRAMPLFLLTSIALLSFWVFRVRECIDGNVQKLAVDLLGTRYKHIKVDKKTLLGLCLIFVGMFFAWSLIPRDWMPPETVALIGYTVGAVFSALRGNALKLTIDFKPILTIAVFLFLAGTVRSSGALESIAQLLQLHIQSPRLLLLAIMVITSIASGLFSAGPAAAAMMPIIVNLCETTLAGKAHWAAIAYAASICAGSSMFLWSATAGFILSGKVDDARLGYCWGIREYLKYGIINYSIQMAIAMAAIMLML